MRSFIPQTWRELNAEQCQPTIIQAGKQYVFNLIANSTVKRYGKRHSLKKPEELSWWINRKLVDAGFSIDRVRYNHLEWKSKIRKDIKLDIVEYTGVIAVVDSDKSEMAYWSGIGAAKGFGCGLLKLQELG